MFVSFKPLNLKFDYFFQCNFLVFLHSAFRCKDVDVRPGVSTFATIIDINTIKMKLKISSQSFEAVFLVMLGTSSFTVWHKVRKSISTYIVPSWERARTKHF